MKNIMKNAWFPKEYEAMAEIQEGVLGVDATKYTWDPKLDFINGIMSTVTEQMRINERKESS